MQVVSAVVTANADSTPITRPSKGGVLVAGLALRNARRNFNSLSYCESGCQYFVAVRRPGSSSKVLSPQIEDVCTVR